MSDETKTISTSLTTARLQLRLLEESDEAAFFALHADPVAMRYWSEPAWTDSARARAVMERDRAALVDGSSFRLGVFDPVDGLIGCCSLHRIDGINRRAEIGYILQRARWGRGLMHEALVALVDWAFEQRGLRRLEADIDPRNAASAGVLARLGFTLEATMRGRWEIAGEVSDSEIYGLLRDEWRARDGASRQSDANCSATVPSAL